MRRSKNLILLLLLLALPFKLNATTLTGNYVDQTFAGVTGRVVFRLVTPNNESVQRISVSQTLLANMTVTFALTSGSIGSVTLIGTDDIVQKVYYEMKVFNSNNTLMGTQYVYVTGASENVSALAVATQKPNPVIVLFKWPGSVHYLN